MSASPDRHATARLNPRWRPRLALGILAALTVAVPLLLGQRRSAPPASPHAVPWDPSGTLARARSEASARPGDPGARFRLAMAYAGIDACLEATDEFRRALELGADAVPARLALSSCYRALGDTAAARQECEAALRLAPENLDVHLALAGLLREAGQRQEAIRVLHGLERVGRFRSWFASEGDAALTPRPELTGRESIADLERTARAFMEVEDFAVARNLGELLCSAAPDRPAGYAIVGRCWLALDDPEQALAAFQRAIDRDPRDPEIHYLAGYLMAQMGTPEADAQALRALLETTRLAPAHGRAERRIGALFAGRGEWSRAGLAFLASAQHDYDPFEGLQRAAEAFARAGETRKSLACIGRYHHQREEYPAALKAYRSLLRHGAPPEQVYPDLAAVSTAMKRPEEAIHYLEKALAAQPGRADFYLRLAAAHGTRQDTARQVEALQRAVALDPGGDMAHGELAAIHRAAGKYDEAEAALAKCLALTPESGDYHIELARLLLLRRTMGDRLPRALRHLERAVALDPEKGGAWQLLGTALTYAERLEEAVLVFQRAARVDPRYGDGYMNCHQLYSRLGNEARAERALASFERFQAADTRREQLKQLANQRPADPAAQFALGEVALRARIFDAAAIQFERTVALAPQHAAAHARLATAYAALGRPEDQARHLRILRRMRGRPGNAK